MRLLGSPGSVAEERCNFERRRGRWIVAAFGGFQDTGAKVWGFGFTRLN